MANVVGERFQITIDKKIREDLGIRPGDMAVEKVEGGRLVVYFLPKPHRDSLLGILKQPGIKPITDWRAVKEAAWAGRSAEIMDVLHGEGARQPTKAADD